MFQGLFGMLVSSLVIFFPVVRGRSSVRVCGEFMEFGSSLVRVIWHSVSIPFSPLHLEPMQRLNCSIVSSRATASDTRLINALTVQVD
jgi:hypothetical protein